MDLKQREIKENNKQINSSASLSSAEKKAPYDIGTSIGAMSVTELAERWELNKHLFNVKFRSG
jgi:hypothetical protein